MDIIKVPKVADEFAISRVSTRVVLNNKIRVVLWMQSTLNENDPSLGFFHGFHSENRKSTGWLKKSKSKK
jgi:hypothetical protein